MLVRNLTLEHADMRNLPLDLSLVVTHADPKLDAGLNHAGKTHWNILVLVRNLILGLTDSGRNLTLGLTHAGNKHYTTACLWW